MKTLINALKPILKRKADVADVAEVQNAVDNNTEAISELNAKVEQNKPPLKINVQKIEGSAEVTYTPTFSEIENAYNEGRDITAYVYEAEGSEFVIMRLVTVINIPNIETVFFFRYVVGPKGLDTLIITETSGEIMSAEWEDERIGELRNLNTTDKDDIVDAINELVRRVAALEGNA